MALDAFLSEMLAAEASDLYLTCGAAPSMKVAGVLEQVDEAALDEKAINNLLASICSAEELAAFDKNRELNIAIEKNGARFRVNAFYQRSHPGCILRHIKTEIPTPDSLGIPEACKKLAMQKRGLILFTGSTGSGKSTSMASLIDYRNQNSKGHIVLIEDPVEFIHPH